MLVAYCYHERDTAEMYCFESDSKAAALPAVELAKSQVLEVSMVVTVASAVLGLES